MKEEKKRHLQSKRDVLQAAYLEWLFWPINSRRICNKHARSFVILCDFILFFVVDVGVIPSRSSFQSQCISPFVARGLCAGRISVKKRDERSKEFELVLFSPCIFCCVVIREDSEGAAP